MKKKLRFNIDRLKICYKQPSGLFEHLSTFRNEALIPYGEAGEFMLKIVDDGRGTDEDKQLTVVQAAAVSLDDGNTTDVDREPTEVQTDEQPTEIKAAVVLEHDKSVFGHICFNGTGGKYDGLCFLEIENAKLYDRDLFGFLGYVEQGLSLKVNSLTQVDVAADVNFNPIPKIRKLIKDYSQFDMIVNGKRVEDPHRTIEHYGEFYGRSREKLNRMPTLYFSQAMSDGLRLKVYNKAKEIAESSGKTYITEANGFDGYRMEVTVRWEQFLVWLNYVKKSTSDGVGADDWKLRPNEDFHHYLGRSILCNLDNESYKASLWRYCVDRLIYFRRLKGEKEVVSLLDIAGGLSDS